MSNNMHRKSLTRPSRIRNYSIEIPLSERLMEKFLLALHYVCCFCVVILPVCYLFVFLSLQSVLRVDLTWISDAESRWLCRQHQPQPELLSGHLQSQLWNRHRVVHGKFKPDSNKTSQTFSVSTMHKIKSRPSAVLPFCGLLLQRNKSPLTVHSRQSLRVSLKLQDLGLIRPVCCGGKKLNIRTVLKTNNFQIRERCQHSDPQNKLSGVESRQFCCQLVIQLCRLFRGSQIIL